MWARRHLYIFLTRRSTPQHYSSVCSIRKMQATNNSMWAQMLQDCAHVILLKVMHFIEKCIYSWWKMRTRTRFQVLSIYFTVNISAKPLVFPNKSIHVGSCQAHYVVILAILQPFLSLAIRSFQFSRSHFYSTVVAICTFSALIDLRQHYTYVCNSNRFFCVLNIHLKCSCHTLQVF